MTDDTIPGLQNVNDKNELMANFNALLYVLTEQMAVNLQLMDVLIEKNILGPADVNEKVLTVTQDQEALTNVYNQLFARFTRYYGAVRQMIDEGTFAQTPAQNSAKPEDGADHE